MMIPSGDIKALILRVLSSRRLDQLAQGRDPLEVFREISKSIHPDVCAIPGAEAAFRHLFDMKKIYTGGEEYEDDRGSFKVLNHTVLFGENDGLYRRSQSVYHEIIARAPEHIINYMPVRMENGVAYLADRSVLLSGLRLEEVHARWVLSRMLEFAALLEQAGMVHMGLCPQSVMLIPDGPRGHGIQVISYYHAIPEGSRVTTISAAYQQWYPASLFKYKTATNDIDAEMAKRTCLALMGDNGTGAALRGTHSPQLIDFLQYRHASAREAFMDYRQMLDHYFEKKYYHLNL